MRSVYILFVVAIVIHSVVALPNCGTFQAPSGLKYNLSPLTRPPTDPWSFNTSEAQYYWNFCANLVEVPIPVELLSQEATAVLISDSIYAIGYLQDYSISELAPGAIQLSYPMSGKSNCPNGLSRNSSIVVTCASEIAEGVVKSVEETSKCSYTISMMSKYACPSDNGPAVLPTSKSTTQPTQRPTPQVTSDPSFRPVPTVSPQPEPSVIPEPTVIPQPPPTPPTPSSGSSGNSKLITILLVALFVFVTIATCRRLRRRAHLNALQRQQQQQLQQQLLQQQSQQQQQEQPQQQEQQHQQDGVPLSDVQSYNYYPLFPQHQQQQMYMQQPEQQQQPAYPTFLPPLHQPFYMVAPQLSQQQQQRLLRQYQRQ